MDNLYIRKNFNFVYYNRKNIELLKPVYYV